MTEIWFLVFLFSTYQSALPMHSFGACAANAVALSEKLETSIACISPDLDDKGHPQAPSIYTNGVMEPLPR